MKGVMILILLAVAYAQPSSAQIYSTIGHQMELIQKEKGVHFIYNTDVRIEMPYRGAPLHGRPLHECLELLFRDTGIEWRISGNNISLREQPQTRSVKPQKYTVCGYVRGTDRESIISATVYDRTTGRCTVTNEYGFYSISLPSGRHVLKISYMGYETQAVDIPLTENRTVNITMAENNTLAEVIVNGDLNSPLLNTRTGKRTLTSNDLNTEFSLLSSPDVIKTLQRFSGVSEGVELASGLYVHGGGNDENLFLLDGTPLYQINHSLGLFSSFNTDIIRNVDFYKSGFPARYSGRLSSVTDVRTKDGDMYRTHGSYSIGLLDGRFQMEGPISQGKTSYNFGLRRSWVDFLLKPAFALTNKMNDDGENYSIGYLFYDLNAKVTHAFSERSRAYLSIYSGADKYHIRDKSADPLSTSDTRNDFNWGNMNVSLNWNYQVNTKIFATLCGYYVNHNSVHDYSEDDYRESNNIIRRSSLDMQHNNSRINDVGVKADFDYRPNTSHRILFGAAYTHHLFSPQTLMQSYYFSDSSEDVDTTKYEGTNRNQSHELSVYAEDEIRISSRLSADAGLNYMFFAVPGRTFYRLDPRLALKYQLNNRLSLKMSFTRMSQYVHLIANTYLTMPTDYWVPTTAEISPMRSSQIAAGLYAQPHKNLLVTIEGFYKHTDHVLQINNWMGLKIPATQWNKNVLDGEGRSYGLEMDVDYRSTSLQLVASYTLSWSKRRFIDLYPEWFQDKFDNRHKINLTGRYKLSDKVSVYAGWTYHSGNRLTLPTQYVNIAMFPSHEVATSALIYEIPNNIGMPAYHRLDVGFDFRKVTKHHHERIWNVSLYNAYYHLNTMYANILQDKDGNFYSRGRGYVPLIPSVSYTIKF